MSQSEHRRYPCRRSVPILGYVLLALGAVLLFACIHVWEWLAVIGVGLMAAGWLILKWNDTWR